MKSTVCRTSAAGRARGALRALCAVFVLAAFAISWPAWAYADSYPHVRIDAAVQSTGDLEVVESRTFEFSDDGSGVYWYIPEARNAQGALSRITVTGVWVEAGDGEGAGQAFKRVSSASKGDDGVYTVERDDEGTLRLMVYSPHAEDETQCVTVGYTLNGAVMAWSDTAELYWQFVGPGWSESSRDVALAVTFPSGSAEAARAVVGETFRAWGHGPLDGSVELDASAPAVSYRAPAVPSGDYAEARIAFPLAWVPELASSGRASGAERLPTIIEEEDAWAREANRRREEERARRTATGVAVVAASCAFAFIMAVIKATHRSPRPRFGDTFLDDVPSRDHPAVIAAFSKDGAVDERAFAATLVKLAAEGAVGVDGPDSGAEGYRLELLDRSRREEAGIDGAALRVLFREGCTTASIDSMADYAERDPERYSELVSAFRREVERALDGSGLIASKGKAASAASLTIGLLIIAVSLVAGIGLGLWVPAVAAIALAVAGIALGCTLRRYTSEGAELKARCDAFERWLEARGEERSPVSGDPAQWGRVLMYAVALGLDAALVRDLARLVPAETVASGGFYPVFWWYLPHGGSGESPVESVRSGCPISPAVLAESSFSSGSGFGGGFTGGGGGVGGGGGGSF